MTQENVNDIGRIESSWTDERSLYRLACLGALLALSLMVLDIGLTFVDGDVAVGRMNAQDWFALYQQSWFMGLRNFGFINVTSIIVSIPLYLALYRLHRKALPAFAALALILYLFGSAIYISNNRALAMLTLSNQYFEAQSEVQKSLLAAAGTVTLAQSEDFTPGTFTGFLLNTTGSTLMMVVMLGGRVFERRTALAGLIGSSSLLVFTIIVTFAPAIFTLAMALAMLGGLLMMAWNVLVALGMFRLGRLPGSHRPDLALQAGVMDHS
jgi:hypothetical protein